MKVFIALAGNMGVGKTTLTKLIASRFGWQPFYEPVEDNPYLKDFYSDMRAWAFHSQLFFLSRRLEDHWRLVNGNDSVIQDRSLYENAEVFAKNLYEQGLIGGRDWEIYSDLYKTMRNILPPPTLIIYLRANVDTLAKRIAARGRDFEKQISPDYLDSLNKLYDKWITTSAIAPAHTIETDDKNFPKDPSALEWVVDEISKAVGGIQNKLLY